MAVTTTIGTKKAEKVDPKILIRKLRKLGFEHQQPQRQQWLEVAQSYHGYIQNRVKGRSNFHHHKIFPQVERATARYMQYYFRTKPYVSVRATGERNVEQARNHERALQHFYEMCPVFYMEKTRLVKYMHMYGLGWQVPSWKNIQKDATVEIPQMMNLGGRMIQVGSQQETVSQQVYDGIWFKTYSPSEVFFDLWSHYPRWVMVEEFVHYEDLLDMARQNQFDASACDDVPLNSYGQDDASFRIRQTAVGRPQLTKDEEMICLQHIFFRDKFITLANDSVIVRDTPNWFWHGEIPVVKGQTIVDPDSPYPMATGVLMLPVQKMINLTDNLMTDHTMQSVNWQWKFKGGVDPNQLLGLPNHRIGPLKNMDDIDIIVPPEVKHDLLLVNAAYQSASDELVGYYSSQKGSAGGTAQTATSDTIFQQEGNIRIASDIRNFEELSGIPEANQTSKNVSQMMDDFIEVAVDDLGGPAFQRLSREEIQGQFSYSTSGATDTVNRAVAQQQVSDFFALSQNAQQFVMLPDGQIVPMPVQNNYEVIKEFYEGMGKRNVSKLLYHPALFGQPLDSRQLLGQFPAPPPGYLQTNPANGGLTNQPAQGRGGRSLNQQQQIQNIGRQMQPTAAGAAF